LEVGGPGKASDYMIPLADMLNHKSPPETEWGYHPQYNGFLCRSFVDMSYGHEITYSYGCKKSYWMIFMNYGFIMDN